tara:strand:+ start:368 stop:673 length:306 start_codon:yes stop_codon:yes gene_type:complete
MNIQITNALLSLGNNPGLANEYACVIAKGAADNSPKSAALNQRVPAHSSGENMLTQDTSHGSKRSRIYRKISSIDIDHIPVSIITKIMTDVKRPDSSSRCD